MNIPPTIILKSILYIADKEPVLALIRADKEVEETKLMNAVGANEIRIATGPEIDELMAQKGFDSEKGFIGPNGMDGIKIVGDKTILNMKNFVVGINQRDKHLVGANFGSDVKIPEVIEDIRLVEAGEFCPQCGAPLKVQRGIEVGNIFQLGTKYSSKMNAVFTDADGVEKPFIMGCYGIGITRTAAAAVERHHDEFGIKWPKSIAPYLVTVVPVNTLDEVQMKVAVDIYEKLLNAGVEVVIDDRDERAGVKFKDADLIGFPYRITVGKTISEGLVEFKERATGEMVKLTPEEAVEKIIKEAESIK